MQVDVHNANIDIESHLHNYKGNILIQRLQFIIEKSDLYRIDALRKGIISFWKEFYLKEISKIKLGLPVTIKNKYRTTLKYPNPPPNK